MIPPADPHVRVFAWSLAVSAADAARLAAGFLSHAEHTRAANLVNSARRREFIAARAGLRRHLAHALGCDPRDVVWTAGEGGKPRLDASVHPGDLRFNLAHSREWAVLALARGREVGVDVEWLNPRRDFERLARRFLHPGEISAIHAEPLHARRAAFHRCWTRKEAYLKATGEGLRFSTRRFEVSVRAGEPCRLLAVEGRPAETARWRMEELPMPPTYAGAVAAEGQDWRIDFELQDGAFP